MKEIWKKLLFLKQTQVNSSQIFEDIAKFGVSQYEFMTPRLNKKICHSLSFRSNLYSQGEITL